MLVRNKVLHLFQNQNFPSLFQQRKTLVNVKQKWVKDRKLDHVIIREKHLRNILHLVSDFTQYICTHNLTHLKLKDPTRYLFRFPSIFTQLTPTLFTLTPTALELRRRHFEILNLHEHELVDKIKKLLMLTVNQELPLHTLDLVAFDLGLDLNCKILLLEKNNHVFGLYKPEGDERTWIKLIDEWEPHLAVSEMERNGKTAFPVRFARGFGMKKKCMEWLKEWQGLEYVSPYDRRGFELDSRTDMAEKRIVGVFHEMLWLMVGKKTERKNVSNMRRVLGLPYKFTKVFERHPGIFYLSRKLGRETVVLREGYGDGRDVLEKNVFWEVREKYLELIRVRREDVESDDDDDDGGGAESENDYFCSSDEEDELVWKRSCGYPKKI